MHLNLFNSLLLTTLLITAALPGAAQDTTTYFFPTWKLLNQKEKQYFISGYLKGWQAAARINEVAAEYVQKHPDRTMESFQSLERVFSTRINSPNRLVDYIDEFYSNPDNRSASLSRAVSFARSQAGG